MAKTKTDILVIVLLLITMALVAERLLLWYVFAEPPGKRDLRSEAVWIARYLKPADYDLARATSMLASEQGMRIEDGAWVQIHKDPMKADDHEVIVVSREPFFGERFAIRKSTFVELVDVSSVGPVGWKDSSHENAEQTPARAGPDEE